MSRIISTLLALALCLGMTAACAPSGNDTIVTDTITETSIQSNTGSSLIESTLEISEIESTTTASVITSPKDFLYEVSTNGKFIYISRYIGSSPNVVIPSHINNLPVTAINGTISNIDNTYLGAFENCHIETVAIHDNIQVIGYQAFKNCQELIEVKISDDSKMMMIDGSAFENCINIKSIDLSSTVVTTLGERTFAGCTNLKNIVFPDTLSEIRQYAFYECSSITELHFPETLTQIQKSAFAYCNELKEVSIPTQLNLFSSEEPAFHNNPSLKKIIFADGRDELLGYAFFSISNNADVVIPKSVKTFSCYPFFISGKANMIFLGDCPSISEKNTFYGNVTIWYYPNTNGWDDCTWENIYSLTELN